MRIIPVLDLMGEIVVRGIAGRRHEYRPVESQLTSDTAPLTVARAFRDALGITNLYVADLDAIADRPAAWETYRELVADGFELAVDAGLATTAATRRMADFASEHMPRVSLIMGLESIPSPAALESLLDLAGRERTIFSLDLMAGIPRTSGDGWIGISSEEIAARVMNLGVRRMIVLDLSRVGMGGGVGTESLCRWIKRRWPGAELIAGGGVRSLADIQSLADAGCDGVLIASALHDGRIGRAEIEAASAPR